MNKKSLKKIDIINMNGKEYITLKTAEKIIKLTASMLRRHIYKNDLSAQKVGRAWIISVKDAISFTPPSRGCYQRKN